MITGELRSKVDKIWKSLWTGGITNPLEVIEQFTYLLFIKALDDKETTHESEGAFLSDKQHLRWSNFKNFEASEMYKVMA